MEKLSVNLHLLMINQEVPLLFALKIDTLQYFQKKNVRHILLKAYKFIYSIILVNDCLLKMGERMSEDPNKYTVSKIKNKQDFQKLENLK